MAKLLLDESPLIVLPSLAKEIGLNEAIVLQQLHYWLQNKKAAKQTKNFKKGRWWVYNTYREWRDDAFIFWSEITIQRIFLGLEKSGLVIGEYLADDPKDRRKWYTIDYVKYRELVEDKVEARQAEIDAEFESVLEEIPSDVLPKPEIPDMVEAPSEPPGDDLETTISTCGDASPHSDAMYRTKTSAKTSAETSPETASAKSKKPPAPVTKPAVVPLDSADAALIASLEEAEVSRVEAKRLALEFPEECRRQLAFLPFVTEFKTTKGGYLRRAIEGGYAPPPGWHEAQKRQEAGQECVRQAQLNTAQKEADATRQAALDAEKARLQAECPDVWATLLGPGRGGSGGSHPVAARWPSLQTGP